MFNRRQTLQFLGSLPFMGILSRQTHSSPAEIVAEWNKKSPFHIYYYENCEPVPECLDNSGKKLGHQYPMAIYQNFDREISIPLSFDKMPLYSDVMLMANDRTKSCHILKCKNRYGIMWEHLC